MAFAIRRLTPLYIYETYFTLRVNPKYLGVSVENGQWPMINVRRMELATRSSVKPARGLERSASMMGRQGVIVTQGANNIKVPSG